MSNLYTNIGMFDAAYYLEKNPALVGAGLDTADAGEHYFLYGATESAEGDRVGPNNWFDINFYKAQNPELAAAGVTDGEMLYHFAMYGAAEGRNPNAAYGDTKSIDPELYLEYALANPELAEYFGIAEDATELTAEQLAGLAVQYFNHGINEGREGGIADITPIEPETPEGEVDLDVAITNYAEAKAELNDADTKLDEAEDAYNEAVAATEAALGDADEETGLFAAVPNDHDGLLPKNLDELSETQQENSINSAKGVLQADVDSAQLEVDLNLKGAALKNAKALSNAKVELIKALDRVEEAQDALVDGEIVEGVVAVADDTSFANGDFTLTVGGSPAIVLSNNPIKNQLVVAPGADNIEGIDELLAAAKVMQKADAATAAPREALAAAVVAAVKDQDTYKDLVEANKGFFYFNADEESVKVPANTTFTVVGDEELVLAFIDAKGVTHNVAIGEAADGDTEVVVAEYEFDKDGSSIEFEDILDDIANGKNEDYEGGGDGFYADLVEAQEALKAFNAAVEKWEDAKAAEADAKEALENAEEVQEAAAEALADAKAAIEALVSTEEVEMNFVEAVNGQAEGTAANDLFVYVKGEELDITKFGQKGEDKLYVGPEYTLVEVESRDDIKGDAGVLEIFVFQEAGNTVLAVEQDPYSGSVAGTQDLTDITLVGVDANIVQDDQGFIVLA